MVRPTLLQKNRKKSILESLDALNLHNIRKEITILHSNTPFLVMAYRGTVKATPGCLLRSWRASPCLIVPIPLVFVELVKIQSSPSFPR